MSLVVADKKFIEIAERNMKDAVPLYYNMRKASPSILTNESIYNGLKAAFVGGNIGIISNNISKIWNNDVFINGTDEEKQHAMDCVKRLCAVNNETIDYAKTLYKSKMPDKIRSDIAEFTNDALPHFFVFAKDKEEGQVVDINGSFVNKIGQLIKNPRLSFKRAGIGKLDYKLLMKHPTVKVQCSFKKNGNRPDKTGTDPLIIRYLELQKEFYYNLENVAQLSESSNPDKLMNPRVREILYYHELKDHIKCELSQFGYTDSQIADRLVKFLYDETNSKYKSALWICYGDILYENLCKNLNVTSTTKHCEWCGAEFYVSARAKNKTLCPNCYKEYRRESHRLVVKNSREKSKM